jgi:hypothetical protein
VGQQKALVSAFEQTNSVARQLGMSPGVAAVVAVRAQSAKSQTQVIDATRNEDNGHQIYDTMGNMPVAKFNRLFNTKITDRQLYNIHSQITTAVQTQINLLTIGTAPCTLSGFRWKLVSDFVGQMAFMLIILREGQTIPSTTISLTNGVSLWQPEEDVVMWGKHFRSASTDTMQQYIEGTNKSYKMSTGSVLALLYYGVESVSGTTRYLDGVVECWALY